MKINTSNSHYYTISYTFRTARSGILSTWLTKVTLKTSETQPRQKNMNKLVSLTVAIYQIHKNKETNREQKRENYILATT